MTMSMRKKAKFDNMKDILFKILFPSKHEEIMSLMKKLNYESYRIRILKERNTNQAGIIQTLNKNLKETRLAAKEYQRKQTTIAEQEYYKTLKAKGVV
jgi:uncharacterized coiled-coil protein SlyX